MCSKSIFEFECINESNEDEDHFIAPGQISKFLEKGDFNYLKCAYLQKCLEK